MGKIKVNEIEKHDASEITVNSTVKIDNITEKTANAGIQLGASLGFVSKTTSQINSLSGMSAGDTVYDSDLGTLKVYNGTSWNAMSNSTFPFTVEWLIVAGGGSGGADDNAVGAGGGAGGLRNSYASENTGGGASGETPHSLFAGTNYTVTIGAGAAAVLTQNESSGSQGSSSSFNSVSTVGGGGGAADS